MWRIFGSELPQALEKHIKIADMCRVKIPLGDNLTLPSFPIPDGRRMPHDRRVFRKGRARRIRGKKRKVWQPLAADGKLKYTLDDYRARSIKKSRRLKIWVFPDIF
jgi:DNA polymerase III alpha subunit